MFPTTRPPSPDVISRPLIFPIQDTLSAPLATPPHPHQVYTRRPCTNTRPLADSPPMALSSMTSVLPCHNDLPIALWKGICSSCNPHLIYNFLTYHHLSSPYFAFISTLSYVSLPKIVQEALPGLEISNG